MHIPKTFYICNHVETLYYMQFFLSFLYRADELNHVSQMDDGMVQQPTTFGVFLVIKISHRTVFFSVEVFSLS